MINGRRRVQKVDQGARDEQPNKEQDLHNIEIEELRRQVEYLIARLVLALVKVQYRAIKDTRGLRSFDARFKNQIHNHELFHPRQVNWIPQVYERDEDYQI